MDQLDIFKDQNLFDGAFDEKQIDNGAYIYIPNFFNKKDSDFYLKDLEENIVWTQESMMMYGKSIQFPRLSAWYGDKEADYSFSGISLKPLPWTKTLLAIKKEIEPIAKTPFNSVLLNQYRDGKDSMGWHTDAEKELGKNPIIASVNFGGSRKFQMKHTVTQEKIEFLLSHGSLLIMQGEMQHFWKHQVPKTKKEVSKRINLTFREIKSRSK